MDSQLEMAKCVFAGSVMMISATAQINVKIFYTWSDLVNLSLQTYSNFILKDVFSQFTQTRYHLCVTEIKNENTSQRFV